MVLFITFYFRESSVPGMPDIDTERKHAIPDSVLNHLTAAYDHAEDDETLYHIREALQISKSEIEATGNVNETLLE